MTLIFVNILTNGYSQLTNAYYQAQNITTILFHQKGNFKAEPVVALGDNSVLTLTFDEIFGDSRTLYYSFQHCDAQWQPSDVMEMDFIDTFNKIYDKERVQFSFNSNIDYAHYEVEIETQELKISGNYILKVFSDEDGGSLLLTRPMMIYEPLVGIASRITRNTDADNATQSVAFNVQYPQLKITNALQEIKVAVWQNTRLDTWSSNATPTFIRSDEIVFDTQKALTFEAGNEARWLDNRNLKYKAQNVANIEFFDPYYHITQYADGRPMGYNFYEDFNGKRFIEARHVSDSQISSDYTLVHFTLPSAIYDAEVYVVGELTNWLCNDDNRMTYNSEIKAYTLTLQIKQGLHNYQYLALPHKKATKPTLNFHENSFPDTENDYHIAVYYRTYTDTYDRLVGYKVHNSLKTPNSFIH